MRKKIVVVSGVIMVILAIALTAFFFLRGNGSKDDFCLYLKEGELFYTDFSKEDIVKISPRPLYDTTSPPPYDMKAQPAQPLYDADVIYPGIAMIASDFGSRIAFSDDGKRIFFSDGFNNPFDSGTLYYRDIDKKDEDAKEIDSKVTTYAINSEGTRVAYIVNNLEYTYSAQPGSEINFPSGADNELFLHDLTDKEKIADNVIYFDVTADLNKIGYLNYMGDYYLWRANEGTVTLANEVCQIIYVAEDLSVFYYLKGNSLYRQTEDGEHETLIASDVSRVIAIYDSGEIYYTKIEQAGKTLMNYVTDDLVSVDATLTEPVHPGYPDEPTCPSRIDYDTEAEYEAAWDQYEIDIAAYIDACQQIDGINNAKLGNYYAKLERDRLREDLKSETIITDYTLYFFDGTEATVVADGVNGESHVFWANEKPVIVFSACSEPVDLKIKLSEISAAFEVADPVWEALEASSDRYIAAGSTLSVIEQTNASYFIVSSDGSAVFFLDNMSEKGDGDLYKINITDDQIGERELYDSDVSDHSIFFDDDHIVYYKSVRDDENMGDLFVDGEEIDFAVDIRFRPRLENGAVFYFTYWNEKMNRGTLKMFKNGNRTRVSDVLYDYTVTRNGDILYLHNYDISSYAGTLSLYNEGNPKKIDDDVFALIAVNEYGIRRRFHYVITR